MDPVAMLLQAQMLEQRHESALANYSRLALAYSLAQWAQDTELEGLLAAELTMQKLEVKNVRWAMEKVSAWVLETKH
jgi:uncharacterized protein YciW